MFEVNKYWPITAVISNDIIGYRTSLRAKQSIKSEQCLNEVNITCPHCLISCPHPLRDILVSIVSVYTNTVESFVSFSLLCTSYLYL